MSRKKTSADCTDRLSQAGTETRVPEILKGTYSPSGVQLLQTGDGKLAKGGFPVPGFNICRVAIRRAVPPQSSRLISVLSVPSVAKLRIFLRVSVVSPIFPICVLRGAFSPLSYLPSPIFFSRG